MTEAIVAGYAFLAVFPYVAGAAGLFLLAGLWQRRGGRQ